MNTKRLQIIGNIGSGTIDIDLEGANENGTKPQSPLKHTESGDYFYPLTTMDQVIMEDGSRLNNCNFLTVDNSDAVEGEVVPVNADTLGYIDASEYVTQDILSEAVNSVNFGALSSMVESSDYPNCYYHEVDGVTEWLNPPMVLGTEYRTAERYKNKPVYTKAINFGSLPNGTQKTVSTGLSKSCEIREFTFFVKGTDSDGVFVSPTTDFGTTNSVWLSHNLTKITFTATTDASADSGTAILKYTK